MKLRKNQSAAESGLSPLSKEEMKKFYKAQPANATTISKWHAEWITSGAHFKEPFKTFRNRKMNAVYAQRKKLSRKK